MFGTSPKEVKFPARFPVLLERKTATGPMQFKCHVTGGFVSKKGRPSFEIETITVDGIPNMNLASFYGTEVDEVTSYALNTVWPQLMGQKH